MQGYLYNVAQSFVPYFISGVFVFAMFVALLSVVSVTIEQRTRVRRNALKTTLGIWAVGLLIALVAPANTYKHEPYNRAAANAQIEQQQRADTSSQEITDRSRKPALTDEQRAKRFDALVDYKNESRD